MQNLDIQASSTVSISVLPTMTYLPTESVTVEDLELLTLHRDDLCRKAMYLTDAWGQAMFVLEPEFVKNLYETLGFSSSVAERIYEKVRQLNYVHHERADQSDGPDFTWHITDGTCLTLRGSVGLQNALVVVNDSNIEDLLMQNLDLYKSISNVLQDYTADLMFSPDVARKVIGAFGADVSADKFYELGLKIGGQRTLDLEGRRGVSTQFIRSSVLALSATI